MQKSDQNHPIWRLLNLVILVIVIWICAYNNASNFDETEVRLIGWVIGMMGGYEIVKVWIAPKKPEDEP